MSRLRAGARQTPHRCLRAGLLTEPPKPPKTPRLWLLGESERPRLTWVTQPPPACPPDRTASALAVPGPPATVAFGTGRQTPSGCCFHSGFDPFSAGRMARPRPPCCSQRGLLAEWDGGTCHQELLGHPQRVQPRPSCARVQRTLSRARVQPGAAQLTARGTRLPPGNAAPPGPCPRGVTVTNPRRWRSDVEEQEDS